MSFGLEAFDLGLVTVIHTTKDAIKVEGEVDMWVPRSVVHSSSDICEDADVDDIGILVVKQWFAVKEGLV